MDRCFYFSYLCTYHETRFALTQGDERRLHDLCKHAASQAGVEGMIDTLAMSDAEVGRRARSRAQIGALTWSSGARPLPAPDRDPHRSRA